MSLLNYLILSAVKLLWARYRKKVNTGIFKNVGAGRVLVRMEYRHK